MARVGPWDAETMTRRGFLLPAAALLARPAGAQLAFPGVAYRDYHDVLPDYLAGLAARAGRARRRELDKLTSAEAIRLRQKWVRETLWRLIGGEPARTPLNARTTGSLQREGYRVEKLVYESRPRFFVTALLYVPTAGRPPYPAVLFQSGHVDQGKAYEPYQRCCQALAKRGFLVLAFDPMGQGERLYYPDESGTHSRLPSSDRAHEIPGRQLLLVGDTATCLLLGDAVRSLDYLAAHPLADAKRLASAGHSGGGTLTMLLAAADPRLAAAAVLNGNTENFTCDNFLPPGSTDDAEQNFVGGAAAGFDRWDLLHAFAPRPLLIRVSDLDAAAVYSPNYLTSGWQEFQRLRGVYATLGAAGSLEWSDTPLPHDLAEDSRLAVCNWLARQLQPGAAPLNTEPPTAPEPEAALRVIQEGSTLLGAKSQGGGEETPLSLARAELASTTAPAGSEPNASPAAILKRLLRLDPPSQAAGFAVLRQAAWKDIDIQAVELESAPGVRLPAWLYLPRAARAQSGTTILVLDPAGRDVRGQEGDLYASLAARGFAVCAADIRGIGDLTPRMGRGNPRYARDHALEDAYAWASLILGCPLAGQRTADILALAAALRTHPATAGRKLRLAATGRLTIPALFAAALDARMDELYLSGPLVSYRSILDVEEYNAAFANFIWAILRFTDLAEIAASIGPRPVVLAGAVDAAGEPLEAAAVRAIYKADNIQVRPKRAWDEAALGGRELDRADGCRCA